MRLNTRLPVINQALQTLDVSPLIKKKIESDHYVEKKINQVLSSLRSLVSASDSHDKLNRQDAYYFFRLIEELRNKFHSSTINRREKLQILTLLPDDWSVEKIAKRMNTTKYIAKASKTLNRQMGILSFPGVKRGYRFNSISFHSGFFIIMFSYCSINLLLFII